MKLMTSLFLLATVCGCQSSPMKSRAPSAEAPALKTSRMGEIERGPQGPILMTVEEASEVCVQKGGRLPTILEIARFESSDPYSVEETGVIRPLYEKVEYFPYPGQSFGAKGDVFIYRNSYKAPAAYAGYRESFNRPSTSLLSSSISYGNDNWPIYVFDLVSGKIYTSRRQLAHPFRCLFN